MHATFSPTNARLTITQVVLSRYDLVHTHLFSSHATGEHSPNQPLQCSALFESGSIFCCCTSQVALSRYDLFHAHLFSSHATGELVCTHLLSLYR